MCVAAVCLAGPASAQIGPPPQQPPPSAASPAKPPINETTTSDRREGSNNQQTWHFIGHVEMDQGGDTKIYADDVWTYTGEDRAVATGNVVFAQGNNRISAERAVFNTETRLGTFYNAWGMTTVKPPPAQAPRPGQIAAPTMAGQESVIYFFGETVEKIGVKKYKITNGGFSTCVQPTPRWDLHAGTVTLSIDHYTWMTNAVLNVKGVPMFYLPVLYYPTKREDRATGFLIPTYGVSSLRGQSFHNAFFWAIDRSQDVTIEHDWFSKTGQGLGSEYRYNMGQGNDGMFRAHLLDEHAVTYIVDGVESAPTPARQSYDIRATANQQLPGNLRARANVSYFSSIESSQTFNTNIYDASRNQRTFGGNVIGAWNSYTLNATLDHSEYFYSTTDSSITGTWPRIQFSRNERPLPGSPAYFSVTTEFDHLLRDTKSTTTDSSGATLPTEIDQGLSRFDISPQIRYPFKKWQWFTVNTSISARETYYSRSYAPSPDPLLQTTTVVDEPLNRPLLTFSAQITGPVFSRVWDTPENGYAEKFKHTIEPVVTIDRTSAVDNFNRIIQFDGIDSYVGGTRYTYGLNNRFYAKRRLVPGQPAQAREIFDVEVTQSYYTDQRASIYDRQYQTSLGATPSEATNFSPIALSIRALPTNEINATVRAEFDSRYLALRTVSAQGSYAITGYGQVSAGWSKRAFIEQLPQFNNPAFLDQSVNAATTLHTLDNRYGVNYSFNYDVLHSLLVQQQITGFYNTQCCGVAFQYQTYNYGSQSGSPIPSDHRFFLSFTLAGLGNFSPFNGALSGVPR
jgi:lipopolysaccharide assembly outer membrane protein LptD (OstA)